MQGVDEPGVEELADRGDPAAESYVLALRRLPRLLQDRGRLGIGEVERGVGERERRTQVVRHHEHGRAERRLLPPPALPLVVLPRAALGPELVAPHDLGADVVGEVPREVVVEAAAPAGIRAHGPARGGSGPGEQPLGVLKAERQLKTLVLTGTDAVVRHVEVHDSQQLNHGISCQVLSRHCAARRRSP